MCVFIQRIGHGNSIYSRLFLGIKFLYTNSKILSVKNFVFNMDFQENICFMKWVSTINMNNTWVKVLTREKEVTKKSEAPKSWEDDE